MRRRKRVIVLSSVVAVVVAVATIALVVHPLVVEHWLIRKLDEPGDHWEPTAERLLDMGSRRGVRRIVATWLEHYPDDPAEFTKDWATRIAHDPGIDPRWALPGFGDALRSERPKVRLAAATLLSWEEWRYDELIPILADALSIDDVTTRRHVAILIGVHFPGKRSAVPPLLGCADDREEDVRQAAVWSLGRMHGVADAVPALVEALDDASPLVAAQAAQGLSRFPEAATHSVRALLVSLGARDPVRAEAARALLELGEPARDALPTVLAELREGDWQGLHDAKLPFWFTDLLGLEAPRLRAHDARAELLPLMAVLEDPPDGFVGLLIGLLDDESPHLSLSAAYALGILAPVTPEAGKAAPALARVLGRGADSLHWRNPEFDGSPNWIAAWALGRIGEAARPALEAALGSSDRATVIAAARAASGLGEPTPSTIAALRSAAVSTDIAVRAHARWSLLLLGEDGPGAIEAVLKASRSEDSELPRFRTSSRHSTFLLGQRAADLVDAVPVLRAAVEEGNDLAGRILAELATRIPAAASELVDLSCTRKGRSRSIGRFPRDPATLQSASNDLTKSLFLVSLLHGTPEVVETISSSIRARRHRLPLDSVARCLNALAFASDRSEGTFSDRVARFRWLAEDLRGTDGIESEPRLAGTLALLAPDDRIVWDWIGSMRDSAERFDDVKRSILPAFLVAGLPAGRVPAFRPLLSSRDDLVRAYAAAILVDAGHDVGVIDPLRGVLSAPLEGQSWEFQPAKRVAARALGGIDKDAREALGELREALSSPDRTLRLFAAEAIWRITGDVEAGVLADALETPPTGIAWVQDRIHSDSPLTRLETHHALRILRDMGPAARDVADAVRRFVARTDDPRAREEALAVLDGMGVARTR